MTFASSYPSGNCLSRYIHVPTITCWSASRYGNSSTFYAFDPQGNAAHRLAAKCVGAFETRCRLYRERILTFLRNGGSTDEVGDGGLVRQASKLRRVLRAGVLYVRNGCDLSGPLKSAEEQGLIEIEKIPTK